MRVKDVTITGEINLKKLMELAEIANQYESDIHLVGETFKIDAKSLMGLLASIRTGLNVTIMVKGEDEELALKTIKTLLMA
ncbi:HPr family phosphocarrier protein [Metabacillus malikii]|uniref:Phosphotransferase system HPr (HPr) family protein n=1 Tax=Metabacillus malikii TaxID=1504265 RepID=A0ABT9ZC18_9BACI|nr:HPr family phosphocarrier protein [Metabacillus malikii]MDQ0228815.1 phosphotransferase system HPr (HPr) family protein [Metabacillus malikii]